MVVVIDRRFRRLMSALKAEKGAKEHVRRGSYDSASSALLRLLRSPKYRTVLLLRVESTVQGNAVECAAMLE